MHALALAAGVGVVNESPLEAVLDAINQGVMDDAIREGRRLDLAHFGLQHRELLSSAWPPGFPDQVIMKLQQTLSWLAVNSTTSRR